MPVFVGTSWKVETPQGARRQEMNKYKVEIIVHVDDTLGDGRREDLLRGLGDHQGVDAARFSAKHPHLVLVDYDPEQIHATDVLMYVRREHVNAELIGGF